MISEDEQSDQEVLQFKTCPLPGHGREPLSRVCIDVNCTSRGFVCYTCEKTAHGNHKTTSLSMFLSTMKAEKEAGTVRDFKHNVQTAVDNIQKDLGQGINRIKKTLDDWMSSLCTRIDQSFNRGKQELFTNLEGLGILATAPVFNYDHTVKTTELIARLHQYLNETQSAPKQQLDEKLEKCIQPFKQLISILEGVTRKFEGSASQLVQDMTSALNEWSVFVRSAQSSLRDSQMEQEDEAEIQAVSNIGPPPPPPPPREIECSKTISKPAPLKIEQKQQNRTAAFAKKGASNEDLNKSCISIRSSSGDQNIPPPIPKQPGFAWSQTCKSYSVEISADGLKAQRFINDPKSMAGVLAVQKAGKWAIRLHVEVGPILSGICIHSRVAAYKYQSGNHWTSSGHGNYLLGTDGYIFSHSDKGLNHRMTEFKTKGSALLHYTYHNTTGTLIVEDKKRGMKTTLSTEFCEEGYRPCVYLVSCRDKAELVDYGCTE